MRMVLLVMATGALLGGVAQAKDNPNAMTPASNVVDQPRAQPVVKVLYVCDEEELSWRAFSRDLGTPDFVTAKQVRADSGKAWAAPKCITASELRHLTGTQVGQLTKQNLRGN